MRLEVKKFKLHKLVKGIVIASLIILATVIFIAIASELDEEVAAFTSINEAIIFIEILVMGTYVIYGSIILAKLTVSEYEKRTMQLMFMYPINRKKLLLSKVCTVYLFTTIGVIVSSIFVIAGVSIMDQFIDIVPGEMNMQAIKGGFPIIGAVILMSGFFAIIPLFFGMRKKSTGSMIGTAIVVVCLACSNFGVILDLKTYLYRILGMGIISVIGILLTMNKTLNQLDEIG